MRKTVQLTILGVCALALALPVAAATASVEGTNLLKAKSIDECEIQCDTAGPCDVDLYAGQFMLVGNVTVTSDGTDLHVVYDLSDLDWSITEVHFYAGDEPPTKAAPGQFPYTFEYLNTQSFEFDIPLAEVDLDGDGCLFFAAHAVVYEVIGFDPPDFDGFAGALPGQVTMQVSYPSTGDPSYFETTVSGGTVLDGTYEGWCIDTDHTIGQNTPYTADVYSSYEDLPDGLVEFPENLDLVNWIVNQGFVGQPSACGGEYTYGDVQRTIWTLIDDQNSTSGLGPWSQCRVDEILAAASAGGDGFVPGCFDVIAVILVPVNGQQITIAQITLAGVDLPCDPILGDGNETAWGGGQCPFKQGWGSYFRCSP